MRSIVVGLLCAVLAATLASAGAHAASIDPDKKAKGMKDAPALITAAGLDCQLADAYQAGQGEDSKTHEQTTLYEIACANSEGFLVVAHKAPAPPNAYSCLELAGAPSGGTKCVLPENANPAAGLTPFVAKVNPGCQVAKARAIGSSPENKIAVFEVVCASGDGYVLTTADPLSFAKPPTLAPCLATADSPSMKCTLSDQASQLARIDQLAAQSGKSCQVKDRRYILTADDGSNYYEIACQDGKGYVLQQAATGALLKTIDCANADYVGGGCTLTNARQAQSEEAGLYSRLAQKAGFDCQVSKYAPLDGGPAGHDVVELACSNQPEGAIGIFGSSASEPGQILPCARSELDGFRCSFSTADAGYPLLTADLKKVGKVTCAVSGSRIVGVTEDKLGIIEVACADGGLGFMLEYNMTTHAPRDAVGCVFAQNIAGGCKLPTNQRQPKS